MVKVALSRFQLSLGPFLMFFLEGTSKTGFYRHWSNRFFRRPYFGKYIFYESDLFFWKISKLNVDFKNAEKNWEKVFCFFDNSISIGCVKFFLLRTEYLSSAVNVVTNSLNVLHSTNIVFFQLNYCQRHQQIW